MISAMQVNNIAIVYACFHTTLRSNALIFDRGGGLGGLVTAVALAKEHPELTITIYEAAKSFGEAGLGIGIWSRSWKILEALGLGQVLRPITTGIITEEPAKIFEFRKSDNRGGGHHVFDLISPRTLSAVVFARSLY